MISFFRFVPHHQIQFRLAQGWRVVDDLGDTYHGQFAVLMQWMGEGEAP